MKRAKNRCERCGIDFDDDFKGEFHHIIPVVNDGENTAENCSLLCTNCHHASPNLKHKEDLVIYQMYFMRFASFKEAANYYGVEFRFELYAKLALEISQLIKK